jgi:hypothetical protein
MPEIHLNQFRSLAAEDPNATIELDASATKLKIQDTGIVARIGRFFTSHSTLLKRNQNTTAAFYDALQKTYGLTIAKEAVWHLKGIAHQNENVKVDGRYRLTAGDIELAVKKASTLKESFAQAINSSPDISQAQIPKDYADEYIIGELYDLKESRNTDEWIKSRLADGKANDLWKIATILDHSGNASHEDNFLAANLVANIRQHVISNTVASLGVTDPSKLAKTSSDIKLYLLARELIKNPAEFSLSYEDFHKELVALTTETFKNELYLTPILKKNRADEQKQKSFYENYKEVKQSIHENFKAAQQAIHENRNKVAAPAEQAPVADTTTTTEFITAQGKKGVIVPSSAHELNQQQAAQALAQGVKKATLQERIKTDGIDYSNPSEATLAAMQSIEQELKEIEEGVQKNTHSSKEGTAKDQTAKLTALNQRLVAAQTTLKNAIEGYARKTVLTTGEDGHQFEKPVQRKLKPEEQQTRITESQDEIRAINRDKANALGIQSEFLAENLEQLRWKLQNAENGFSVKLEKRIDPATNKPVKDAEGNFVEDLISKKFKPEAQAARIEEYQKEIVLVQASLAQVQQELFILNKKPVIADEVIYSTVLPHTKT